MKKKILVVEDDADLREVLVESLRVEGWESRGAADGGEALRLLKREGPFAAIVLDLRIPVVDGADVHRVVERDRTLVGTPTILISGDVWAPSIAAELGLPLLRKPFDVADLAAMVRRTLRAPSLQWVLEAR